MDHLPLPPTNSTPYITIPYSTPWEKWYFNEGFHTFPSSRGWTQSNLRGGDNTHLDASHDPNGFHTKGSDEEVEQFFQTWLFFGLVIDVLKVGKVPVTTEDFLRPFQWDEPDMGSRARVVDTSNLPALLVTWAENIKRRNKLSEDWERLNAIFETAGSILDQFCSLPSLSNSCEDEAPLLNRHPRPWPVRDEISTSIIALANTLRQTALKVCDKESSSESGGIPWPLHARSKILTRRLNAKWCIADVTTTLKQLSIDGVYYLAAPGSAGLEGTELDHHANCIPEHCLYEFDASMYVTKHAITGHHCPEQIEFEAQLGPERGQRDWDDAVGRIIEKGAIPIALWNKGSKKVWSVEWHFEGKRKPDYVAISHVWADGHGNPRANTLPQCQMDRIQRLVEAMHWEGRKPVPSNPYLSDGIGFWMDTLCLPVSHKERKDKAIASMRHVYSNAKAVLVLDNWLQQIRSDAHPLDVIARVYQSNWLKRLWTHQEGFLPKLLYFQFQDRSVEIHDLKDRLYAYVNEREREGVYLSFPQFANIRLILQYTFLEMAFKNTFKRPDMKWTLYKPLAAALSERKTSRLADETVCLATIVDVPVGELLEIPSKPDEVSGMERMEKFLLMLGKFDTAMIFNYYPRLEKRGYKWAPRSLLNHRKARIAYWGRDEGSADMTAPFSEHGPGPLGLLVHYRGFVFKFPENKRPSLSGTEHGFAIQVTSSDHSDRSYNPVGKWFIVQVPRNNGVLWAGNKTYAVILSEIPSIQTEQGRGQSGFGGSPAVIAAVDGAQRDGVHIVDHLAIASVWVRDDPPEWGDRVDGRLFGREKEWLVR
ncbi:uncharacterized protein BDV14DRAFT_165955 [Aspergillus stella-maris]|uniref:uncharacterized protein n=1 Tax=Aspergillus stella-maris TaxID=1810926 RepID=UPI003CCDCCFD